MKSRPLWTMSVTILCEGSNAPGMAVPMPIESMK